MRNSPRKYALKITDWKFHLCSRTTFVIQFSVTSFPVCVQFRRGELLAVRKYRVRPVSILFSSRYGQISIFNHRWIVIEMNKFKKKNRINSRNSPNRLRPCKHPRRTFSTFYVLSSSIIYNLILSHSLAKPTFDVSIILSRSLALSLSRTGILRFDISLSLPLTRARN